METHILHSVPWLLNMKLDFRRSPVFFASPGEVLSDLDKFEMAHPEVQDGQTQGHQAAYQKALHERVTAGPGVAAE